MLIRDVRGWDGWALVHPEFGNSVNPIQTGEDADYAHHIIFKFSHFVWAAPNLMHSFNDDLSKGNCPMSLNSDRMDHVSALKLLVERRDLIYQVPSVELNDAYFYLNDHFPDVLDALLRRRSALAGVEIPEDFQIEEESDKSFDLCRR